MERVRPDNSSVAATIDMQAIVALRPQIGTLVTLAGAAEHDSAAGDYSWRNAANGSIREARRAGSQPATIVTTARTDAATTNTDGCVGVTPNSRLRTTPDAANAATAPSPMPGAATSATSRSTRAMTWLRVAPSAI